MDLPNHTYYHIIMNFHQLNNVKISRIDFNAENAKQKELLLFNITIFHYHIIKINSI